MSTNMNTLHRKSLPGTQLDYFDTRAAVDAIQPGAYATLPYTSRVLAENLVRRCDPATLNASLSQFIERRRDLDFPWFPARVVCHDILGQTALVDLAGLRDAIAAQGGDPALVNPVVPTQLIVDHSLAVECGGFDPDAFAKNRAIEDRRNEDRFHFIDWTKKAFKNVDVMPAGQRYHAPDQPGAHVARDRQVQNGVAYPDTLVGTDSATRRMVDALGVIAIGVGGLEAESVMLGRASWMRLPDIIGVKLTGKPQPGITATDTVLALTEFLRKQKVVGVLPGILWRRRCAPDAGRPRDDFEHGARVRRHRRHVLRSTQQTIKYLKLTGRDDELVKLVGAVCQRDGPVVRQPGGRAVRARLELRPVVRRAQYGRPVESAQPRADVGPGRARHFGRSGKRAGPDAGRRRHHRRHHQLHQHEQPAQRDRRRFDRAQREPPGPDCASRG